MRERRQELQNVERRHIPKEEILENKIDQIEKRENPCNSESLKIRKKKKS